VSTKTIGGVLGALLSALALATYVARSTAAAEVRPIESRVTRLEALREEDAKRLEKMDQKLDEVLRLVRN
jgi:hypothetical protein